MGDAIREIIKALKEMPNFLLFALITISLNILFWFIAIFLFHKDFYQSNPTAIVIVFAVALALVWFGLTIVLSGIRYYIRYSSTKKADRDLISFVGGFASLIYLLITITGFYIYRSYGNIFNFNLFLIVTFGAIFIGYVRGIITLSIKVHDEDKIKKAEKDKAEKKLANDLKEGFEEIINSELENKKNIKKINDQLDELKKGG